MKLIIAILRFFHNLRQPATVASVLSDFHKKIVKLEKISDQNRSQAKAAIAEKHRVEEEARRLSEELSGKAESHDAEADTALTVAGNIHKLLNA